MENDLPFCEHFIVPHLGPFWIRWSAPQSYEIRNAEGAHIASRETLPNARDALALHIEGQLRATAHQAQLLADQALSSADRIGGDAFNLASFKIFE